MTVSARFYVATITRRAYNPEHALVTLVAAGRGEQNKAWAQATPSGKIELTINNPAAAKWFEEHLAKDVALTFEHIDDAQHVGPHSA